MKKVIYILLVFLCSFCSSGNNAQQNISTAEEITTPETTPETTPAQENPSILDYVQPQILDYEGLDLKFVGEFNLFDSDVPPTANSISDIDKIYINNDPFYLLTFTYAKKIILVDLNFENSVEFLDYSNLAASSLTGTESGLINISVLENSDESALLLISYVDKTSRLKLDLIEVSLKIESSSVLNSKNIFTGNQNLLPQHYGGSIFFNPLENQIYFSVGDHNIKGLELLNNFSPEGKILRFKYTLNKTNPIDSVKPDGKSISSIYNMRNGLKINELDTIFLSGFRNPWQPNLYKDTTSNKSYLIIGDVGDRKYEELNIVNLEEISSDTHFGWPIFEGAYLSENSINYDKVIIKKEEIFKKQHIPFFVYEHKDNSEGKYRCAIILGDTLSSDTEFFNNMFIFTDVCSGELFGFKIKNRNISLYNFKKTNFIDSNVGGISPNVIRSITDKTFVLTFTGQIFQIVEK